jgi:hypothetical protein
MPRAAKQRPEGKQTGDKTRHGNDRAFRSIDMIVTSIEKASGAAPPSDVLMLCRMYRSQELTIGAQREVIQKLGREKVAAEKSAGKVAEKSLGGARQ